MILIQKESKSLTIGSKFASNLRNMKFRNTEAAREAIVTIPKAISRNCKSVYVIVCFARPRVIAISDTNRYAGGAAINQV